MDAFLIVKELSSKSCPLQSIAQESLLFGLSIYILEGLLCAKRCCAQVQCPPFKIPLDIKSSSIPIKCGVYIFTGREQRRETRNRAFYCLSYETSWDFFCMIAPENINSSYFLIFLNFQNLSEGFLNP